VAKCPSHVFKLLEKGVFIPDEEPVGASSGGRA
jgi:hypothetical protein